MRKLLFIICLCFATTFAYSWGQNGHRIVGYLAQLHLSKKAKKNLSKVLEGKTLAQVSTYMDFIKSDNTYRHMGPWHYATIPDDQTYAEAGTPEESDIIATIERLIAELESKNFTDEDELFALSCLVHLIGDIHQPLHVGNGEDKGGNDVKLKYFWEDSNLHRVWDSEMIDGQQLSFTEYTHWLNRVSKSNKTNWQNDTVLGWANESKSYRKQVYDLPENMNLTYRYNFDNIDLLNLRLQQAGIRLAGVLNKIYG
ncbi:MAG: S1/P1 nuclease [Cyclobacteriaceae bacterium]